MDYLIFLILAILSGLAYENFEIKLKGITGLIGYVIISGLVIGILISILKGFSK